MVAISVVATVIAFIVVDSTILGQLVESLSITVLVALACAVLSLPLTICGRVFHRRMARYVLWASVAFLLIPIPALTLILTVMAVPYSRLTFLVTLALASFPIVFVAQYISFDIPATAILVGRQPGTPITRLLRKRYPRELTRAILAPSIATGILSAFDPGIALVAGTSQPAFGRTILNSLSYYAPSSARTSIVVLCAVASLWMILPFIRPLLVLCTATRNDANQSRWRINPPRALTALSGGTSFLVLTVYLVITIGLLIGTVRVATLAAVHAAAIAMVSTLVLTTFSLGLASAVSVSTHWIGHRRARTVTFLHMWLAGLGLTGGGLIVAMLSHALSPWGLPPLVGGAAIADGALAIIGAQFLVAYPILYLLTSVLLVLRSPLIVAAYDAGASPARAFFTVFAPTVRSHWLLTWVFLVAFFMTRAAPAIFVDSPTWPQLGPTIALEAGQGNVAAVFVLSAMSFGASLFFVALSSLTFTRLTHGSYSARS